jgi:hypothetical protein
MEEEMTDEAPGATTFTLYIPVFLREYSLFKQSLLRNRRTSLCERIG